MVVTGSRVIDVWFLVMPSNSLEIQLDKIRRVLMEKDDREVSSYSSVGYPAQVSSNS